ncbi:ankyrin repeat domain-containing protein 39 homolog [Hyalella azteca]|uniref:Ankyrin repeat domain-containing protein 39 homolog n=1 Tax=Hyalella azteca TaxID=294128 RepID=A0A979FGQ2_HYAAZ|nr:ankyrin repeat domain-containing protein 39 homolog [Hyalella azteca]
MGNHHHHHHRSGHYTDYNISGAITTTTTAPPASGVWTALAEGKAPVVRTLLNELCSGVRSSLLNSLQPCGLTPLCLAVACDLKEALPVLLEKGACVRTYSEDGLGPLHLAALRGAPPLVNRLLSAGASWTDGLERDTMTPLECAMFSSHQEVTDMAVAQLQHLQQHLSRRLLQLLHARLLFAAVRADVKNDRSSEGKESRVVTPSVVTRLVKRGGVDVNLRSSPHGNTALHHALMLRSQAVVRNLIELNADDDICNTRGCSPQLIARLAGISLAADK